MKAAGHLIESTRAIEWNYDPVNESHILFAIQPKGKDLTGRRMPVATMATHRIWQVISYAAAQAQVQDRIRFYQMISEQPDFRGSAGQMFERFVLSWLASDANVDPLRCIPAAPGLILNIPACGKERTYFFGSKTALKEKAKLDEFPVCLLPISKTHAAVDAIVLTNELIITIQVTISDLHSAKGSGFDGIQQPEIRRGRSLRHVFITDKERNAKSLRGQKLSELPNDILLHSGIFDVGHITLEYMRAFDEKKVSRSWLHVIGAYWGIISNVLLKIVVWISTMKVVCSPILSPSTPQCRYFAFGRDTLSLYLSQKWPEIESVP
jgi:hypothetical protein